MSIDASRTVVLLWKEEVAQTKSKLQIIGSRIDKMGSCLEEVRRRTAVGMDAIMKLDKIMKDFIQDKEVNCGGIGILCGHLWILTYFRHIMRVNGLEKMLGKIEGRPAMSWLEGIQKTTRRSLDESDGH
ncbi:hypothetical protein LAZ67_19000191 [Cordylochernes scorpioides]|uniref:Uncharacterized protein n=1 Tax=Cordylochernes scorpioides TaxID=51811 RepID=A0ABY6LHU0_9ARAC|nr:hypothetical protein LAZ67_19000191 [Cordylochernes scorpioides]